MAAKIYRINYKSDFILTLESDAGWMTPFCIKFWTGAHSQAFFVGWDGETYTHCAYDPSEPTKLLVQFDDHHLPIGDLKFQIAYHFTVADFPNDTEDEVINPANITTEIDGKEYQVMLDFTGETAPEIEFSLPAYANEAQRIANEEQRIANETQRIANEETRIQHEESRQAHEAQRIAQETARVNQFATLKSQSQAATRDANDAATLANQKAQLAQDKADLAQAAATLANHKAQLAADKAALANAAAQLANEKAALAQQKAEYAQTQGGYAKDQGDYAKDQGDYAKAQGDTALADHQRAEADHGIAVDDHTQAGNDHTRAEADHGIAVDDHTQAGNDHTRAESDHGIAVDDHTQAGNDHTRAESDHGIAADDHTQAGNDHTRAESDHTRAESDHASVEVYVDSLGAFDISSYHATGGVLAKYADLAAALGTNGANIPDALRKGGMSVKFVLSSDNKYVQYRLMATSWSTTVNDWQGVDEEPVGGSHNLLESGSAADKNVLPVLGAQTVSVQHEITSAGVRFELKNYQGIPAGYKFSVLVSDTNTALDRESTNSVVFYFSDGSHISSPVTIGTEKSFTLNKTVSYVYFYASDARVVNTGLVTLSLIFSTPFEVTQGSSPTYENVLKLFGDNKLSSTFPYFGVAIPETTPVTPSVRGYYLALTSGTYTNFGNIVVNPGECAILKYDGSTWKKEACDFAKDSPYMRDTGYVTRDMTLVSGSNTTNRLGGVWRAGEALNFKAELITAEATGTCTVIFNFVDGTHVNKALTIGSELSYTPDKDVNSIDLYFSKNNISVSTSGIVRIIITNTSKGLYALASKVNDIYSILSGIHSSQSRVISGTTKFNLYCYSKIPRNFMFYYEMVDESHALKYEPNYGYQVYIHYKDGTEQHYSRYTNHKYYLQTDKDIDYIYTYTNSATIIGTGTVYFNVVVEGISEILFPDESDIFTWNKEVDFINKARQLKVPYRGADLNTYAEPVVLAHFSDIHADQTNLESILKWCKAFMPNKDGNTYINDIIHTGDAVHDTYADGFSFWGAAKAGSVLNVVGNHDVLIPDGSGYAENIRTAAETYAQFFEPYIANWNCQYKANLCYYYKDYLTPNTGGIIQGVRLIVIDCMHYDSTQNSWLASTLASALSSNYAVVIATHGPIGTLELEDCSFTSLLKYGLNQQIGTEGITGALDAVDAFIGNGGEFICWIGGHIHKDNFGTVTNHSNQTFVLIDTAKLDNTWTDHTDVLNSKSMTLFNLISFDTTEKLIRLVRVGSNLDRYMRKIDSMGYRYKNFVNSAGVTMQRGIVFDN